MTPSSDKKAIDLASEDPVGGPVPVALIVGMPWFRSGTANVMQSQVKYFKDLGLRTIFACVPRFTEDFSTPSRITNLYRLAGDLEADEVHFADCLPHKVFPEVSLRQKLMDRLFRKRDNALETAFKLAAHSEIPPQLKRNLRNESFHVIIVNHVYAMPFALRIVNFLRKQGKSVPVVSVTHDVQTLILLDNNLIRGVSNEETLEELDELETELEFLGHSDALIHVGDFDQQFFGRKLPGIPQTTVYPFVAPIPLPPLAHERNGDDGFIFVGTAHIANVKAMEWFFVNVWPLLDGTPPKIRIFGGVSAEFNRLFPDLYARHRSLFNGKVDDLATIYAGATAVLAPMVSGRGISVKTIEAAATGKPIVGMPHAFRGISRDIVEDCGIEIANNAVEFAQLMKRALADPQPMAVASRKLHERLFQHEAFTDAMDGAMASAGVLVHRDPQK